MVYVDRIPLRYMQVKMESKMTQRFRYLVIGVLVVLLVACNFAPEEEIPPIERDDLIGTWTADYSYYNKEPEGITLPNGKRRSFFVRMEPSSRISKP